MTFAAIQAGSAAVIKRFEPSSKMASLEDNTSTLLNISIRKETHFMEILRSIWMFIQNQVLGMKWLNEVIGNGLTALGVDIT